MTNLHELPPDLPVPADDGACRHLLHQRLPDITLTASNLSVVNPSQIQGWQVIYCYPMTGQPDTPLPNDWNTIPGARGCTPQSCAFRDHFSRFKQLGVAVFGLSTQSTAQQQEAAYWLHLPYVLLSDEKLSFALELNLPTFEVENKRYIKRLTLVAINGVIQHCFYPVFPPDKNAEAVLDWLEQHV